MLAVSNESEELVSEYVEKMGLTVRTAAGFSTGEAWGVKGYPSAVLIDAEGVVAWTGHPGSLSKGKVKEALKGAKGGAGGYLSFTVARELDGKLKKAVKEAADGKLGKSYAAAMAVAADETGEEAVRDEAKAFAGELSDFASLLRDQAEGLITRGMVLEGLGVLEDLNGALDGMELQNEVAMRLEEIRDDEAMQTEIEAAEALEKAMEAAEKRGMKKAIKKFEAVVKKYPGTKAAARAQKKMRAK